MYATASRLKRSVIVRRTSKSNKTQFVHLYLDGNIFFEIWIYSARYRARCHVDIFVKIFVCLCKWKRIWYSEAYMKMMNKSYLFLQIMKVLRLVININIAEEKCIRCVGCRCINFIFKYKQSDCKNTLSAAYRVPVCTLLPLVTSCLYLYESRYCR